MSKGHSFDQVLNLKQTTILAPQLQQGVHLLQLSSIELQNEIDIALASNPFLEKLELEFSPEPLKADALIQQNSKLDRRSDLGTSRAIQGRSSNASSVLSVPRSDSLQGHRASDAGEMPVFQLAEEQTLQTHLQQQARSTPLNAKQHHILELLIDSVNDNGYLRAKLSDIVELAMPDYVINRTDVQAMIGVLQDFEPVGVGARTASECLLIQLREKAIETPGLALARQISKHYLHLLASQKTEEIAAKLKLKGDELKTALALIRTLNPFPGSVIAREAPRLITPDLVVKKMGERWVVRLNPNVAPSINMHSESDGLLELARGKKGYENLKQEWQKAQTLLSNLEKRYRTLIHVATIIVDRQNEYFDYGAAKLKPLAQKDVAEQLSVHVSTISRAVNDKFMLTPTGVIELREFFSTGMNMHDGGHISAKAIEAKIVEMIGHEPGAAPLSDHRIALNLSASGISIARRTVAKYRQRADIPASSKRRKREMSDQA